MTWFPRRWDCESRFHLERLFLLKAAGYHGRKKTRETMTAKPKAKRVSKKKRPKETTWTAGELLKLPRKQQSGILEAAAAAAEHEYRTNRELNLDLDVASGLNGDSAKAR